MADPVPAAYYVTALDRLGLALLAGGAMTGMLAAALAAAGGTRSPLALMAAMTVGTVVAMLGIVVLAGPVWLLLHRIGRRGPGAAAATGGLIVLAVVTVAQAGDVGGGYRLASALATSLPLALAAAAVGAVMQRVAYRRLL